jgi:hypothetical protein
MNRTRIAILGTLSDLHRQPIRYDLGELKRIVTEMQPDLLGVEVERDEFERDDLNRAPVEVREALIPLARRSDTVVVPIGAWSNEELRASSKGIAPALVRGLDAVLVGVQKTANDARRVNSKLVSHACGLICHIEENVCGERGRRAWETTNEKILANIVAIARRDPQARVLVAVQCRRKHWLEPKLRHVREVDLVNYWEL